MPRRLHWYVYPTLPQAALTVNVNLYDYDDATAIDFPSDFGGTDKIYMFVWDDSSNEGEGIKDLPDDTPWACIDITNNIKGGNSPCSITVDSFNTAAWGGNTKNYLDLDDKTNLKVRVIHTTTSPSLGSLQNKAQYSQSEFDEL